jgi:hypothetical protein
MSGILQQRWVLAIVGAMGGAALYALFKIADGELLPGLMLLPLLALVATFFGAVLAAAGPIGFKKALVVAAALGIFAASLTWLSTLRFNDTDDFFNSPLPVIAAFIVATLPLPFLMAQCGPGWRDYPSLFTQTWAIAVRYGAAGAFVGVVWIVIYLSDELFSIVGLTLIRDLLDIEIVPFLITGAVLGLAMAVMYELADLLSHDLVVRLFRLLLPVVLVVMVVFLLALPLRGLTGLFDGFSPAAVLLTMIGAGIGLVSITVDQSDDDATKSPFLSAAAQLQALILPVMAGFAAWAIALRVVQYGWTPERILAALVAALALAYALIYALAVILRAGWMERIRRGNLWMALAVIVVAALTLTPILDVQRISANNQMARFEAGKTPVDKLDVYEIRRWGKAGTAAYAALEAKSKEPGQEELAKVLESGASDPYSEPSKPREPMIAELKTLMPLQPETATGTRDSILAYMQDYELENWINSCKFKLPDGRAGCVMAVADLLPLMPGEEIIVILNSADNYAQATGIYLSDGLVIQRSVVKADGIYPTNEEVLAWLRAYQDAPPPLTPATINQLGTGPSGAMFLP